jgi:hypothetical protein
MDTDGERGKWTVDGGERRVWSAITADYEIYSSRNVLERGGTFSMFTTLYSLLSTPYY